jgi:peptidoglycan/LPS O-acetylase OafA/YrhL
MAKAELNEVFLLRGLASIMVCLFHLTLGNSDLLPSSDLLERSFSYGYLGVEIFFILSGYVICYSLPKAFNYSDLGTFFLKRLSRIEPPFVISILLVLVLNYLSHQITELRTDIDIYNLLFHLAYLNNFIDNSYVNVVYWTLGIEFQFYILIGLLFPIIASSKAKLITALVFFILLACMPLPKSISVILPYLSFFGIGMMLFSYKLRRQFNFPTFLIISSILLIQIYFYQGFAAAAASLATIFVILFWKYTNRVIRFFSTISFSLYLIHVPVGGKVINLGARYANTEITKYLLILLAFTISIIAAYLFYKFIEKPSFTLSKSLKYRNRHNNNQANHSVDNYITQKEQPTLMVLNDTALDIKP